MTPPPWLKPDWKGQLSIGLRVISKIRRDWGQMLSVQLLALMDLYLKIDSNIWRNNKKKLLSLNLFDEINTRYLGNNVDCYFLKTSISFPWVRKHIFWHVCLLVLVSVSQLSQKRMDRFRCFFYCLMGFRLRVILKWIRRSLCSDKKICYPLECSAVMILTFFCNEAWLSYCFTLIKSAGLILRNIIRYECYFRKIIMT